MTFRFLVAAAVALTPVAVASADTPTSPVADAMRAHIGFLADDLLEGRETGARGHEIAARYVASEFATLGLRPATKDGWFQSVPMAAADLDLRRSKLTINGKAFANRRDVLFGAGRTAGRARLEGGVVFVGYGIDDPARGFDDYRGLDVKGKIVATLVGFPKGMPSDIGAHYGRTKPLMAERHGAIGVITIRTRERERTRAWTRELEGPFRPGVGWTLPDGSVFAEAPTIKGGATLHDRAAAALFAGAPVALSAILDEADREGGKPRGFALKSRIVLDRTTTLTPITSPNVVAMIPGSDPALAGEAVLLMAHLDHIGIDAGRKNDTIFNGAMDNASGVAATIEAARMLAAGPRPRRTIVFAAVTGEEHGLVGADYLARHPIPGIGKVVGVVNLDMPVLLYDFKDVIAFGAEHSTMGPAVARAGAGLGIALAPDPLPSEGLFARSDHYRFVQQGVPSVFLMTGFSNGGDVIFRDFLKTHYHQPSDQPSLPFDWNAAAKFATINARIAAEIANADTAPRWYADSFFGAVFAPDATKEKRP